MKFPRHRSYIQARVIEVGEENIVAKPLAMNSKSFSIDKNLFPAFSQGIPVGWVFEITIAGVINPNVSSLSGV